jgi:hypothetical protein
MAGWVVGSILCDGDASAGHGGRCDGGGEKACNRLGFHKTLPGGWIPDFVQRCSDQVALYIGHWS